MELSERIACSGMNGAGRLGLGGAGANARNRHSLLPTTYQLPTLFPGAPKHTTAGP